MVQCAGTKAMAGQTTRTEHRKVGRVHIMLGLEGPDRPESLEPTQRNSNHQTGFVLSYSP